MENNTRCDLCNVAVSKPHWARHLESLSHLRGWAQQTGVHDYMSRPIEELKTIKQNLEKWPYNRNYHFLDHKTLAIHAAERGMETSATTNTREELIDSLKYIDNYPNQMLHLYTLQHLRKVASDCGLTDVLCDTKDRLIQRIYWRKGLYFCETCGFASKDHYLHNVSKNHMSSIGAGLEAVTEISKSELFRTIVYNNMNEQFIDVPDFLESTSLKLSGSIERELQKHHSLKVQMVLECKYKKEHSDFYGPADHTTMSYCTKAEPLYKTDNIMTLIKSKFQDLQNRESKLQPPKGSGWSLASIVRLIVNLAKHTPLSASSYIDLPKWVKDKKACINIKNKDNFCFIYSVMCGVLDPKSNPERPYHYKKHINDDIFRIGFTYPMSLNNIGKFEKKTENSSLPSLAINVFEIGRKRKSDGKLKEDIRPLRISNAHQTAQKSIDLLLISDGRTQHYVYIKHFSRLVSSQLSRHNGEVHICRRCMSFFQTSTKLQEHEEFCGTHKPCAVKMPAPGSVIKFKNYLHKFPVPYVVYADFEALSHKLDCNTGEKGSTKTIKLAKHIPYGFAIYLVSRVNGEMFQPQVYRAKSESELGNVPKKFVEKLHRLMLTIADKYENVKELHLTPKENEAFVNAVECHICEKPFLDSDSKARDHCHLSGQYLGAAHRTPCNTNRELVTNIPVFFHGLSNYDSHLFIEDLFHHGGEKLKTTVLANSEEKYISFQKLMMKKRTANHENKPKCRVFKFTFVDTFRFMSSSIQELAKNLERNDMKHMQHFVRTSAPNYLKMSENRSFQLLRGKGVFPYTYVDLLNKLDNKKLLEKGDFFDLLNDEDLSQVDYLNYKLVWNHLKKRTLGYYSDLYNLQDVILLADIFENFRDLCLSTYGLDPGYYLTAPSLAWDAMLKITKCEIGLISDPTMHLMFESAIRGGIAQVCKRYVKANNPYIEGYDPSKPKNFLMYLDACNLYGWALSQSLPYNNFEWVDVSDEQLPYWDAFIRSYEGSSADGYLFEVNLKYPEGLHDLHKQLPVAPEHYNNKLCTTLHDKKNYVVHIMNLKFYLQQGLEVENIKRIVKFHQRPFIKEYVELNVVKRQKASNDLEKSFFKLMVNSVFGRTMINLRKRQNISLGTEAQACRMVKKPNYTRHTMFSPNFFAVHRLKNNLLLNQPIQVGCAVLELSKSLMYEFFYDKLKVWDPSFNLVLMDTDSYLVEMSQDPYRIIESHLDDFDTSNYPSSHPCHSIANKNIPGKMKDELGGVPMSEVCGLRPKLYTFLYGKEKSDIKAKGIKKKVARRTIRMDHFKETLFQNTDLYRWQTTIRSRKHKLHTENQRKLALSANDDKRCILPGGIETVPWGHKSLMEE